MDNHISEVALALVEGRLAPGERARAEAHLDVCAACRAEVDDLRHLIDVLAAAPRALDQGLARRRSSAWANVWARVDSGRTPAGLLRPAPQWRRQRPQPHGRVAWGMAVAASLLVVSGLLISPVHGSVLAASGPSLQAIQTPASPGATLTIEPAGEVSAATFNTTATITTGQTPAPIPNP